jgi:hypothetical protein
MQHPTITAKSSLAFADTVRLGVALATPAA